MFVFDIETLSTASNAVILSAAIIYIDTPRPSFEDMLNSGLVVKFNAEDQIMRLKRNVERDTMDWWSKQHKSIRDFSMKPLATDLLVEDGVDLLLDYVKQRTRKNIIWTRGSMDQTCIDDLCKQLGKERLMPYNTYRDVRTAVDCLTGSKNGYCAVDFEGFESYNVIKHNPLHDCALDAMMLLYGKTV